jgi:hypothetical protein
MNSKNNLASSLSFLKIEASQTGFTLLFWLVVYLVCCSSLSFPHETPEKAAQISEVEALSNELTEVHIIGAYWRGDPHLPNLLKGNALKNLHFVVAIKEWIDEKGVEQLYDFSSRAAKEITLKAENRPDITAALTKGAVSTPKIRGFWFKINEEDLSKMVPNIPYTIHIENTNAVYRWIVEDGVTLTRPEGK